MILGAKAAAIVAGRVHVSGDDLRDLAEPALAHRLALNFEGHAERVPRSSIVADIVDNVPAA